MLSKCKSDVFVCSQGVLTGFDRIVFKGTILPLAHEDGPAHAAELRGHIEIGLHFRVPVAPAMKDRAVIGHGRDGYTY